MIQTKSYNDFSSYSYEQRTNYNFMLNEIKEFYKNGGDVSLMVLPEDYSKKEIISFRDYIMKNISNAEGFFQELTNEGILPGLCDFDWDENTGIIKEKKDFGLRWMKDNYDKFSGMINGSISSLLKKLPEDLSKIHTYIEHDYNQKEVSHKYEHPLFYIARELKKAEIYDLIFNSKPDIKKEWLNISRDETSPAFLTDIEAYWSDVRKPQLGILFYKHNICKEYMLKPENKEKLRDLIFYASHIGDIEFLKDVLPKINLKEIEENQYASNLCITKAKNIETAKILLAHNATIEQNIDSNGSKYHTHALFSGDLNNKEVFEVILDSNKKYSDLVIHNPTGFYSIMEKKSVEFSKLLIEKYNFPIEKHDMLYIGYSFQNSEVYNKDIYSWFIQHGADVRNCHLFCEKVVNKRDSGLKELKALTKEGLIVSKSPDIIFNIFRNTPTKIFQTYYEKTTSIELEKYTKDGLPAWWGASQKSDLDFMLSRVKNHNQLSQNGMPVYFYSLIREIEKPKYLSAKEVIYSLYKKMIKKEGKFILDSDNINYINEETGARPEFKFDISFIDEKGNNLLHYLLHAEEYGKTLLDVDLFKFILNNSEQNIYELLSKENKDGITPLEVLIGNELNNNNSNNILRIILNNGFSFIDLTKNFSNGSKVSENILNRITTNDKEYYSKVNSMILDAEMSKKDSTVKKIKI